MEYGIKYKRNNIRIVDAYENPEYAVMTLEEFYDFEEELDALDEELKKSNDYINSLERKFINDGNLRDKQKREIKRINEEKNQLFEEIQALKEQCDQEVQKAKKQNEGLLRIIRQRQNKEENIKKEHDGYFVVRTKKMKDTNHPEEYKSILQTPLNYVNDISWDYMTNLFYEEFSNVAEVFGIEKINAEEDNGTYKQNDGECTLYKWDVYANFRTGHLEATIFTTRPILVEEDRMICNITKRD